ncbi:uncharacterized protein LOC121700235 [Alosa sapidissima]|uniref:uncharacterized protein LOC121700235 n=1 Tax=Alosa sapidissima TaxID=34773 RepID=UPI001C0966F3|nr:uncharacterized protein LOC121700235 [Alosa sapidissima]XP_041939024.1 uncharacterized protein LOC121700235 [Alosa sapidissima]
METGADRAQYKRGKYKRFLDPDYLSEVPKTSKWRTNQSTEANVNTADEDGDIAQENSDDYSDINFQTRSLNPDLNMPNVDTDPHKSPMDSPLHPGSEVTLAQCIVLILAFALRHSLPSKAIEDLLKLLNVILPPINILPHSLHIFKKCIQDPSDDIRVHLFCKCCGANLAKETSLCEHCGDDTNKDNVKEGDFFISLSIENQIRDILQRERLSDCAPPGNILRETNYRPGDISLLWNCDGVPIFNSSFNSLWPIRCVINELPAEVRYKNVLLAGVWFGRGKPNMLTFLHQFVQDIKTTNTNGITWKHPHTGLRHISRVFPIACTCDAVAKCMLQGIHQFNGSYGCGCCLNEGLVVAKGRGFTRVYDNVPAQLRTHEQIINCGEEAVENNVEHVLGVKMVSPLILLHSSGFGFDMVKSFPVDYMHAVLLGVTKHFLDLWFNSKYHESPWYIGTAKNKIDKKLLSLTPPSDVPRVPRTVESAQKWKAAECVVAFLQFACFEFNLAQQIFKTLVMACQFHIPPS